jgi:hypothetical protein
MNAREAGNYSVRTVGENILGIAWVQYHFFFTTFFTFCNLLLFCPSHIFCFFYLKAEIKSYLFNFKSQPFK